MLKRVAVVTGGGRGIGRAIAEGLAARGESVYIFDKEVSPTGVHNAPDVFQHSSSYSTPNTTRSGMTHYVTVDVSNESSIRAGIASVMEQQRAQNLQPRIDILINNAGITRDGLVVRMDSAAWDAVCDVNLRGAFLCAKYALPHLMRAVTGYIINISSIVGLTGNAGQANYAASKAGLIGLTKSLAQEYAARNILVNAVTPGLIATDMTIGLPDDVRARVLERILLRRAGTPEDVAALILFLTSGHADYITGQVMGVDGGLSLS